MKHIFFSLIIVIAVSALVAFTNIATSVKFLKGDWESSKNKALSEGKLYFVDFDASYCATCRTMDETTYMDEKLADYMNKNVVALKVDVQDFDGVMWSQQYEVEALPTLLVFNQSGKLVKRMVGYKSAEELLSTLKDLNSTKTEVARIKPMVPDMPLVSTKTTPAKPDASKYKNGSFKSADMPEVQPQGFGLFHIAVNRHPSSGYSVQLGVFSTYKSVLEEAEKFNRRYSKKTLIHLDEHNGSTVYKLMLGVFNSKRDASYFRNDLRKDNLDGLIKDLSLMG